MANKKLVIWGASGHALVVANIVRLRKEYEIIGYLDDMNIERKGESFNGSVILGGREQLTSLREQGVKNIIIGIGDCNARLRLSDFIKSFGFSLITAIHPQAIISSDVRIGNGTVINAGVIIDPGVIIGENVIINKGVLIGHGSIIGDGVHIAGGTNVSGNVKIGRGTFIGVGTSIIERINIGSNSVIGAGSVIVRDIPDNVIAYGVPAKVIREKEKQDEI